MTIIPLYLIEILHQTTTWIASAPRRWGLYLIEILHQTTTVAHIEAMTQMLYLIEILHQTTTYVSETKSDSPLYLIEILHQTTTFGRFCLHGPRCILLKFYIKPQPGAKIKRDFRVVSY